MSVSRYVSFIFVMYHIFLELSLLLLTRRYIKQCGVGRSSMLTLSTVRVSSSFFLCICISYVHVHRITRGAAGLLQLARMSTASQLLAESKCLCREHSRYQLPRLP